MAVVASGGGGGVRKANGCPWLWLVTEECCCILKGLS